MLLNNPKGLNFNCCLFVLALLSKGHFFHFNFDFDTGKENLANHLLGNMPQGQKRHQWILWCAHNLRLILMKSEPVLNKRYRISAV